MHLRAYIPDGDEPSEWLDVRMEAREREKAIRRLRRISRLVDRRKYRWDVRRRWRR